MTWTQFSRIWEDWGPLVAIAILVIILIVFVWKIWPFLRRLFRIVDASVSLPESLEKINGSLEALTADVAEIRGEVSHNHGTSLKDAVVGIQRTVEAHGKILTKLTAGQTAIKRAQTTAAGLVVEKAERDQL